MCLSAFILRHISLDKSLDMSSDLRPNVKALLLVRHKQSETGPTVSCSVLNDMHQTVPVVILYDIETMELETSFTEQNDICF